MQAEPLAGLLAGSAQPQQVAVEPPAVNVPARVAGKPSSAMSQRIARPSTKLPSVAHHRCGTATAWTSSAAAATSVGIVMTQPEKPG